MISRILELGISCSTDLCIILISLTNDLVCSIVSTVHLAVACGVYDGVFLCCPFSHEVSWMRS